MCQSKVIQYNLSSILGECQISFLIKNTCRKVIFVTSNDVPFLLRHSIFRKVDENKISNFLASLSFIVVIFLNHDFFFLAT